MKQLYLHSTVIICQGGILKKNKWGNVMNGKQNEWKSGRVKEEGREKGRKQETVGEEQSKPLLQLASGPQVWINTTYFYFPIVNQST